MNKIILSPSQLAHLKAILGQNLILPDNDLIESYAHDETEDFMFPPSAVALPETTEEISQIMKFCNAEKIPVTPMGARTGLSGGALAIHGGLALATDKLNKILDIDMKNLQVTTEPGVITQVLQEAVIEKGLFYPPDPASKGSCFIGGNVAENSGGPKAVKYGVVKDYVLNLEMVLPTGEIIWTGANVLKNSTGYNLTQLVVGSEGTLGIITKIVLKLIPYPQHDLLMLVHFPKMEDACEAVSAIFQAGITPSGLEFMEKDAIQTGLDYLDDVNLNIPDETEALLLIEVDGNDKEVLFKECEKISELLMNFSAGEILFAEDSTEKNNLWRIRRVVGEAIKTKSIYKEEDTVVPRALLPDLVKLVKEVGNKYGFKSVCYGHAGDGNLHVNILKGDLTEEAWNVEVPKGIREIFEWVHSKKGTISGEHGIGLVQKDYMDIVFSKVQLDLMKNIKSAFDPNGILNPGKIFT